MTNISSKFYSKSFTLAIVILQLIKEGFVATDIARKLNLKKSHVSYYIKKAKTMGFVNQVTRDVFSVLELTQAGKNLLDQYNRNNPSIPVCRAENIQFIADIFQMPTIQVDWKKIQMRNWIQYTSKIDEVKVNINIGKNPTIVFIPSPVDGVDPYEVYTILVTECLNVALELYDKIGLKVRNLRLSSRGEWLVYDPIARLFCKTNGQVTYDRIGKVNASPPRRIGEFEFHDPRALQDYLRMPGRIQKIEELLEKALTVLESDFKF